MTSLTRPDNCSRLCSKTGLLATSINGFGFFNAMGYILVPLPAAKITACIFFLVPHPVFQFVQSHGLLFQNH